MPRPYRLGQRKVATDETRARIIAGAREILLSDDGYRNFTMDAIARHTSVARMTVYYQFQSKTGLFEALADDIAERGEIRENLERAFTNPDTRVGLALLIDAFVFFWLADADVMRKLNALSQLDKQSHASDRDAWRKQAIERMVGRAKRQHKLSQKAVRRGTDALLMMTTFAAIDGLARSGYSQAAIAGRIRELAGQALGLDLTI
ncbi:MAG TPA: helix-turn-helix domain-containing protein [Candidatus Aquilonibacter sp.]